MTDHQESMGNGDPGGLDEVFADWVDGRLDPEQAAELEARLIADPELAAAAEEYRNTVEFLRGSLPGEEAVPEGLVDATLAELATPPRSGFWPVLGSLAAAAALVLAFVYLRELGSAPVFEQEPAAEGLPLEEKLERRKFEAAQDPEAGRASLRSSRLEEQDRARASGNDKSPTPRETAGSGRLQGPADVVPKRQDATGGLIHDENGRADQKSPRSPTRKAKDKAQPETKAAAKAKKVVKREDVQSPNPGRPSPAAPAGPGTPGPAGPAGLGPGAPRKSGGGAATPRSTPATGGPLTPASRGAEAPPSNRSRPGAEPELAALQQQLQGFVRKMSAADTEQLESLRQQRMREENEGKSISKVKAKRVQEQAKALAGNQDQGKDALEHKPVKNSESSEWSRRRSRLRRASVTPALSILLLELPPQAAPKQGAQRPAEKPAGKPAGNKVVEAPGLVEESFLGYSQRSSRRSFQTPGRVVPVLVPRATGSGQQLGRKVDKRGLGSAGSALESRARNARAYDHQAGDRVFLVRGTRKEVAGILADLKLYRDEQWRRAQAAGRGRQLFRQLKRAVPGARLLQVDAEAGPRVLLDTGRAALQDIARQRAKSAQTAFFLVLRRAAR